MDAGRGQAVQPLGCPLPALLVGWCTALATTTVLARGESMGARLAGVTSAVVGIVLGALVLKVSGLL